MPSEHWFTSTGFMPHGHCYLWTPAILWMHVLSDILIGLAYLLIPTALYTLHRRRPDLDFNWLFVSFSGFIVACGVTHWLAAWDIWHAEYWFEGIVKVVTAALSIPTAWMLWRALPQVIALPSHEALTRANAEKEVLLKEIHHRVKNNLAIVSSLFYLGATRTKEGAALKVLQESQDRVQAMALVHEALYQSHDLAAVDFGRYADTLSHKLLAAYVRPGQAVALHTDLESLPLSIETAVPCGLILNELVTNALKHAFARTNQGTVSVSVQRASTAMCVMTVTDDGVGVDVAHLADDTLGLRLVRLLAQQLNAEFTLRAGPTGTLARLALPAGAG